MPYSKLLADYERLDKLSDIFLGFIVNNKSYQANYFNYLMLKYRYTEVHFSSNDSKKIEVRIKPNTNERYINLCNIYIFGNDHVFKFEKFSIKNDVLGNILIKHINTYKNKKKHTHDDLEIINLPIYGETRLRSASFRNGDGFDIIIRYLTLFSGVHTKNYSFIIKHLLTDREYIKSLSEYELNTINSIYYMLTEDKINFNNKDFSNYILLIEMLET